MGGKVPPPAPVTQGPVLCEPTCMPNLAKKTKKVDPPSQPKSSSQKSPAAPPPEELSPKAAEKAFEAVRPRMQALDAKNLAAQTVDIEKAAFAAAGIGRWVKSKGPRARFARLPQEDFDQAHVEDLETVALAAWHAAVTARTASAGKSEAKLPADLVRQALDLKERMLELVTYHFGNDPVDGPEIQDIKLGNGYADLAADLVRLRKLYAKHREHVKLDPKNYRKTDEAGAGKVAHHIFQELGESRNQDQKTWADLSARAFTLLVHTYAEVSGAGQWLWRHEDGALKFPSLYLVGRAAPSRAAGKGDKPAGDSGQNGAADGDSDENDEGES
jgi:hypothetical protein